MSSRKPLTESGGHVRPWWARLQDPGTARTLAILLLYWAVASLATSSFMYRWSLRENEDRYDLPSMLAYRAERPFVYRALIPVVVNEASRILPQDWKQHFVDEVARESDLRSHYFKGGVAWTPEFSFAYCLIYYLDFICLLLTLITLRAIVRRLPQPSAGAADFTPIAFSIVLPTAFLVGGYFYDFPELLFLALAYLVTLQGRNWILFLIVPLAAANKETAILLPALVSPILWARAGPRRTLAVTVIATLLGLAALLGVRMIVDLTRGTPVILHFVHVVKFWLHPGSYFQFTDILAPGIPFPKPGNVLFFGTLAAMVLVGWKAMTELEKQLLVLSVALNFPLALLFGAPAEFRNFSLAFVPLTIACYRFFSRVHGECATERASLEVSA